MNQITLSVLQWTKKKGIEITHNRFDITTETESHYILSTGQVVYKVEVDKPVINEVNNNLDSPTVDLIWSFSTFHNRDMVKAEEFLLASLSHQFGVVVSDV